MAFQLADLTVARVAKLFPNTLARRIELNLPGVVDALRESACDRLLALAALGTIRAETESFEPIAEAVSKFNTSPAGRAFDLYDNRAELGNLGSPDGWKFRGRGYVQLTGRFNYAKFGKMCGLTLEDIPDLAGHSIPAAKLLVFFLTSKGPALREAMTTANYAAARRLVNGGCHGLDRFTDAVTRGVQEFPA